LASAILWVSSFFFTLPAFSPLAASIISPESFSAMECPLRDLEYWMIQRIARASRSEGFTSIGTW